MVSPKGLLNKLAALPARVGQSHNPDMGRFVVMGLPRSGTTYTMTLLNSHRDISCNGEQFNPKAVVGVRVPDDSSTAVLTRDSDPVAHLEGVFKAAAKEGVAQGGFKFMLGHNITVLRALLQDPDLKIIHVWRENRLAQVASLIKAAQSKRWAQSHHDGYVAEKIDAQPRQISKRWHEFETTDFLAAFLLESTPQQVLTLEYKELFQDDACERLCAFLGVDHDPKMKSSLVKQGSNCVKDRFLKPGPIVHYFNKIGKPEWLGEEL